MIAETTVLAELSTMHLDRRALVIAGAVSIVTMPITAVWFLLIGFLTFIGTAMYALLPSQRSRTAQVLSTGGSVGLGLLIGPTIYLGIALLT